MKNIIFELQSKFAPDGRAKMQMRLRVGATSLHLDETSDPDDLDLLAVRCKAAATALREERARLTHKKRQIVE